MEGVVNCTDGFVLVTCMRIHENEKKYATPPSCRHVYKTHTHTYTYTPIHKNTSTYAHAQKHTCTRTRHHLSFTWPDAADKNTHTHKQPQMDPLPAEETQKK
jgi:hypothetical protein